MGQAWVLSRHYTGTRREVAMPAPAEAIGLQVDAEITNTQGEFWHEGDPMPPTILAFDQALKGLTSAFLVAVAEAAASE